MDLGRPWRGNTISSHDVASVANDVLRAMMLRYFCMIQQQEDVEDGDADER